MAAHLLYYCTLTGKIALGGFRHILNVCIICSVLSLPLEKSDLKNSCLASSQIPMYSDYDSSQLCIWWFDTVLGLTHFLSGGRVHFLHQVRLHKMGQKGSLRVIILNHSHPCSNSIQACISGKSWYVIKFEREKELYKVYESQLDKRNMGQRNKFIHK